MRHACTFVVALFKPGDPHLAGGEKQKNKTRRWGEDAETWVLSVRVFPCFICFCVFCFKVACPERTLIEDLTWQIVQVRCGRRFHPDSLIVSVFFRFQGF